ncbi:MAG: histidinol dehydrogenase [Thermaerobacter sp.]|nr:histidinol dehydrogenase [Thermaerobacter sp.]
MPLATLDFEEVLGRRRGQGAPAVRRKVAEIVEAVRVGGDETVRALTREFDGVDLPDPRVPAADVRAALAGIGGELRGAIEFAAERVRTVCSAERPLAVIEVPVRHGVQVRIYREPIERVAVYVPAGRAPLPSSAIMGVTPAQVAGVREIVVLTPPGPNGKADRTTLAACALLGVEEVFLIGGAQAVAAAAYGTKTLRPVHKLVGPGNIWVTEAKRQLQGVIGIDGLNGPSEVLVLAEPPAPAQQIARDLLAQAEHDPESWAVLVTSSPELRQAVEREMARLVQECGAEEILGRPGVGVVLTPDAAAAVRFAAAFAPEHLELWGESAASATAVRSAGAVFVACPTPLGDYAAGPNHILPTGGSARYASPLGVEDFMRRRTETQVVGDASSVVSAAATLADAEGLSMHRMALQGFQEVMMPWRNALQSS